MDPYSPGARALGLVLRTGHLLAMAVFVGGVFLAAPDAALRPWATFVAVTGIGLLASEVSHGPRTWAFQIRGLAVIVHVAALGLLALGLGRSAATLALVVGAAGSHAPKSVRKWSVRHGRVVDERE